jgi:hypothetical protein
MVLQSTLYEAVCRWVFRCHAPRVYRLSKAVRSHADHFTYVIE